MYVLYFFECVRKFSKQNIYIYIYIYIYILERILLLKRKKIIEVIDEAFPVAKRKPEK